jgi:PAS domain S-box-containing protein
MELPTSLKRGAALFADFSPNSRTSRLVLGALAVGAYAITFLELYELYDIASLYPLYLAAALVLIMALLFGFAAGVISAVLTFPLNALLLTLLDRPGWSIVTSANSGALQAAVLVIVLGAVIGGLRDIGERMRLEMETRLRAEAAHRESEERYRIVVEGASDAIFALDESNLIAYANPAAERIFGHPVSDLIHRNFQMLVAESAGRGDAPAFPPSPALLSDESKGSIEISGRRRDGARIPLEVSFGEYYRDREHAYIGILRDITDRKQVEVALKKAKDAAEQANTAKSEFLSRMSHELRTPLNAVLGFGQLLEMDELNEEQREGVDQILKAGRHLLDLINEVLDIARIEAGRLALSLEPTPLGEVVREACELVRPIAGQRAVSLDSNAVDASGAHVLADRQRLKQVMLNLLSNAVKYNREGGSVSVTTETDGGEVSIHVADSGIGIPGDRLDALFTPFERLDADRTGIEGTGLGLALSRRLVQAMGGRMLVASEVGTGSTFTVILPVAENPVEDLEQGMETGGAGQPDIEREAASRRTVLYIENNISNFRLIERVLAHRPGIDLLPAMQGHLGLELAREHHPDLILLDLHLPDMHGSEVLAELHGDDRVRDIPVVVVSADATPGQIQRLLDAGARDYLTKPLDVQQFLSVLDETLLEAGKADDGQ